MEKVLFDIIIDKRQPFKPSGMVLKALYEKQGALIETILHQY